MTPESTRPFPRCRSLLQRVSAQGARRRRTLLLALLGLLSGCDAYSASLLEPHLDNRPDTRAIVGELWEYIPDVDGGVLDIQVRQGPPGMFEDDSGLIKVVWTPGLAHLGTHEIVLDIQVVGGGFRVRSQVRVDQDLELGVAASPRGYPDLSSAADLVEHFEDRAHGRARVFLGPWRRGVASAGEIPEHALTAMEEARTFGFLPVVGLSWADADGTPDLTSLSSSENSWRNAETRERFRTMVETFAMTWQPPYLFLGDEIDRAFESSSPEDWEAWVSQLEDCARAVRTASPETRVFTTFQLEFVMGLVANAGHASPARWDWIDRLQEAGFLDALGFTSYPHLEFDAVAELPRAHWEGIGAHWQGPVVFTSVAWPFAPQGTFPGDEIEQAEFVSAFLDGIATLDVDLAAWSFLHEPEPSSSASWLHAVGLRDTFGLEPRASDAVWQVETGLRQRP